VGAELASSVDSSGLSHDVLFWFGRWVGGRGLVGSRNNIGMRGGLGGVDGREGRKGGICLRGQPRFHR
jgi:hypothetical protein